MNDKPESERREEVRSVLEKLSPPRGSNFGISDEHRRQLIEDILSQVMPLVCSSEDKSNTHYANLGKEGVETEIKLITQSVESLSLALSKINITTSDLIFDAGIQRYTMLEICADIIKKCQSINTDKIPQKPSRSKTKFRAVAVAESLAWGFEQLTGDEVKSSNVNTRFCRLLKDVFAAAAWNADVKSCAEAAAEKRIQIKAAVIGAGLATATAGENGS